MLGALVFVAKTVLLVALAVWVADRPGTVMIDWLGFTITMHIGIFLLVSLGVILLALFLFRVLKGVSDLPKIWSRYRRDIGREKGYRAFVLGLSAVAAGDSKAANYQAFRAQKLMPEGASLGFLLKAQSARLDGDHDEAMRNFSRLLDDKNAAFLGLRGLLQSALESKNYDQALDATYRALKLYPRQGWILKIAYDLEIRKCDFNNARKILYRAEKVKAIPADKAQRDRIAMLLHEADQDREQGKMAESYKKILKAYGYDRYFIPSVTRYASTLIAMNKRRSAIGVLEKTWKVVDHPDLLDLWILVMPKTKLQDKVYRLNWLERLLALNPQSAEAQMALGRAALDIGLWGEARSYFKMAEDLKPSKRLYGYLMELEEKSGRHELRMREWMQKSLSAPADCVWMCRETNRVYKAWSAFAIPHNSFNTMIWDVPIHLGSYDDATLEMLPLAPSVLEAPKF
jgi:HemY protein